MKHLWYLIRRFNLTVICKLAAVLATKFKTTFTFNLLAKALYKRDVILCREAKFCMQKVVNWQNKAQNCIIAHHKYEQEMKKEKSVVDKKENKK